MSESLKIKNLSYFEVHTMIFCPIRISSNYLPVQGLRAILLPVILHIIHILHRIILHKVIYHMVILPEVILQGLRFFLHSSGIVNVTAGKIYYIICYIMYIYQLNQFKFQPNQIPWLQLFHHSVKHWFKNLLFLCRQNCPILASPLSRHNSRNYLV